LEGKERKKKERKVVRKAEREKNKTNGVKGRTERFKTRLKEAKERRKEDKHQKLAVTVPGWNFGHGGRNNFKLWVILPGNMSSTLSFTVNNGPPRPLLGHGEMKQNHTAVFHVRNPC